MTGLIYYIIQMYFTDDIKPRISTIPFSELRLVHNGEYRARILHFNVVVHVASEGTASHFLNVDGNAAIYYNRQPIEIVTELKYLGVTMQPGLGFSMHVKRHRQKAIVDKSHRSCPSHLRRN